MVNFIIVIVEQNWFAKNGIEHRDTKTQSFIFERTEQTEQISDSENFAFSIYLFISPCLCVLLYYSRTKLVCEKWIGTQRHKGTEFYFFERTEFTVQSAGFMIFAFSV